MPRHSFQPAVGESQNGDIASPHRSIELQPGVVNARFFIFQNGFDSGRNVLGLDTGVIFLPSKRTTSRGDSWLGMSALGVNRV